MIDMTFIRTIESALSCAFSSAFADGVFDESRCAKCSPEIAKICKDAAQRLFFELDGLALIDLGIAKLAAEQQGALAPSLRSPPPAAMPPERPTAAV